jgi:hypothetical protein
MKDSVPPSVTPQGLARPPRFGANELARRKEPGRGRRWQRECRLSLLFAALGGGSARTRDEALR